MDDPRRDRLDPVDDRFDVRGSRARVEAPAKLTTELRVTGVRDDGYHLIDAEMISLHLADVLTIDPAGRGITVTGRFADGVPDGDDNLVAGALRLAGRQAAVTIDKRIPHGGGLGGGSTDAAAVLRWAGFGGTDGDFQRASALGADIPFCLFGGRSRVTGIGEFITPLPFEARVVTLVIPPLVMSTPAVYRAWDDLGGPTADGLNDLEAAAVVVEPRLAEWRDRITDRCGAAPTLAGSGATWWIDGARDDALADLSDEGATVLVTSARRPH